MKLGLKLWSTNTDYYFDEAKRLYEEGWFDYIELYVVPKSLNTLDKWKTLNIPFVLHAPHFTNGFNLAKREYEKTNFSIYQEVKQFADKLAVDYIVFHGGIDGEIEETARQLKNFNEPRALIENKPYKALPNKMKGEFCRGGTLQEIEFVMKETGCGFCLDVGHCFCSANSQNIDVWNYLKKFQILNPASYHFSDNFIDATDDKHLHLGQRNYDFKRILDIINLEKNVAVETNKISKIDLDDFIEDVKWLRHLKFD